MSSAFSLQNSISLCPTSFRIPRPNFPVTPGVSSSQSMTQNRRPTLVTVLMPYMAALLAFVISEYHTIKVIHSTSMTNSLEGKKITACWIFVKSLYSKIVKDFYQSSFF